MENRAELKIIMKSGMREREGREINTILCESFGDEEIKKRRTCTCEQSRVQSLGRGIAQSTGKERLQRDTAEVSQRETTIVRHNNTEITLDMKEGDHLFLSIQCVPDALLYIFMYISLIN